MKYKRVVFVCRGNIIRSVIAEYLFKKILEDEGVDGVEVCSAGLLTEGSPPHPIVQDLLKTLYKIDVSKHRSKVFREEFLDENTLVLTMETSQRDFLRKNFPQYVYNIYTLKEYTEMTEQLGEDIEDPLNGDIDKFIYTIEEIHFLLEKLVHKLFQK